MKNPTEKTTANEVADSQGSEKENGEGTPVAKGKSAENTKRIALRKPRPAGDGAKEAAVAEAGGNTASKDSGNAGMKAAAIPVAKPLSLSKTDPSDGRDEEVSKDGIPLAQSAVKEPDASADGAWKETAGSEGKKEARKAAASAADAERDFAVDLDSEGEDDEYEWSDWSEEAEQEKFVRPKKIVPVIAKPANPAAAAIPDTAPVAVPAGKSGGRLAIMAGGMLSALALAAGIYAVTAIRSMSERLDSFESAAGAAAEAPSRAVAETATGDGAAESSPAESEGEGVGVGVGVGESASDAGRESDAGSSRALAVVSEEPEDFKEFSKRLEYLERRAKLTKLADEAISSGSRYAFNQLEAEFEKPGLVGLKVAANSEIIRVESIYAATSSMSYREIPTDMIDPTLKSDTEMSIPQLGDILLSSSVPAEARARAAELLAEFRSFDACSLLVECIRTEPNLAVLVEATRSFKQMTGYPGARVFAGPALEEWFEANRTEIRMAFGAASVGR